MDSYNGNDISIFGSNDNVSYVNIVQYNSTNIDKTFYNNFNLSDRYLLKINPLGYYNLEDKIIYYVF